MRALAGMSQKFWESPLNPHSYTVVGKSAAAACELFESTTRRYGKPEFGLKETVVNEQPVPVTENIVWGRTYCELIHFERDVDILAEAKSRKKSKKDPKVLIVAPLSGHYATLLRGTVEAMLPDHEVYITDWTDARMIPIHSGRFDLNDYVDYLIEMIEFLGPNTHVMAVCQPGPAALAATAIMAEDKNPCQPASLIIMGSPIDTRKSPTAPTELAEERPIEWFERNAIMTVPWPHPGVFRQVYPGFIQLSSFMAMNRDRHMDAHQKMFFHLVDGDGDSQEKHREFYDEYLSVMDLTSEFYLQTVEEIFQKHSLPKGEFEHRGRLVDTTHIRKTALMTVEGENDDISGIGQTQAAHDLCHKLPASMKEDYVQPGVGHYGVFNGRSWRDEIQPRVGDFIKRHDGTPKKK